MTVEKLRLTLQATDLNNVAGSWKGTSDPYAEVTLLTSDGRELKLDTPKTEVVKNNLSPEWTTSFLFDRSTVEETSIIKVSVVDEVTKEKDPDIPMGCKFFICYMQCRDDDCIFTCALTHDFSYNTVFTWLPQRLNSKWKNSKWKIYLATKAV